MTYDYYKGTPGCMYLKNGDPGYPPEPAEVDIIEVVDAATGAVITNYSDDEQKQLELEAFEDHADSRY